MGALKQRPVTRNRAAHHDPAGSSRTKTAPRRQGGRPGAGPAPDFSPGVPKDVDEKMRACDPGERHFQGEHSQEEESPRFERICAVFTLLRSALVRVRQSGSDAEEVEELTYDLEQCYSDLWEYVGHKARGFKEDLIRPRCFRSKTWGLSEFGAIPRGFAPKPRTQNKRCPNDPKWTPGGTWLRYEDFAGSGWKGGSASRLRCCPPETLARMASEGVQRRTG